jgi:hypothetical protein
VRTEAEEGQRRGILIPVLLDEVVIPLAFRRIQAASLVGSSGAQPHTGFNELAGAVARKLSPAGATAEPPVKTVPVAAELPRPAKAETEQAALVAPGDVTILTKPATEADPAAGETHENPKDGLTYVWIPHDGLLAG